MTLTAVTLHQTQKRGRWEGRGSADCLEVWNFRERSSEIMSYVGHMGKTRGAQVYEHCLGACILLLEPEFGVFNSSRSLRPHECTETRPRSFKQCRVSPWPVKQTSSEVSSDKLVESHSFVPAIYHGSLPWGFQPLYMLCLCRFTSRYSPLTNFGDPSEHSELAHLSCCASSYPCSQCIQNR